MRGNGTFELKATTLSGLDSTGISSEIADLNNDGLLDIVIACDPDNSGGKIFCLNEDGVTFVLRDSDQFELLHTNPLSEDDMGMATPAIAGDRLLIRTSARLYCIKEAIQKGPLE